MQQNHGLNGIKFTVKELQAGLDARIAEYAAGIIEAEKAALNAHKGVDLENDGGTCNHDTPLIDLGNWRKSEVHRLRVALGEHSWLLGTKLVHPYFKGCYWLNVTLKGQGDNRSRMAEAAYKRLRELGLLAELYQQMD